jgi:hypothetical protein
MLSIQMMLIDWLIDGDLMEVRKVGSGMDIVWYMISLSSYYVLLLYW